jgi:hypothetical protein
MRPTSNNVWHSFNQFSWPTLQTQYSLTNAVQPTYETTSQKVVGSWQIRCKGSRGLQDVDSILGIPSLLNNVKDEHLCHLYSN